jgi:aspartyl-tRNA(Asn)/glutamyl-tRNA(Gln) amidotransferase subunit C
MLTPEEVRHVAMLARLGLTDEEVDTMRAQLVQVLDYIAMLEKLDTSQIPPTAQILTHLNVVRQDVARPSLPTQALLANAPAREGDLVRVPAVLEEFKGDKGEANGSEVANA